MEISSEGYREEKGRFSYQIVEVLTHVFIVKLTIKGSVSWLSCSGVMANSDAKSKLVQSHLVEIYIKPQQTFLDKVQTKE